MTRSCGALLMAGEGKSREKKGAPPLPFLRRRPLVPSRAGSPADVSQPGHVLSARVEAGGAASRGRAGGAASRGQAGGAAMRGGGQREWGGSWRCLPLLGGASLPHTWMYRSAVRSTLKFDVFLSSTLGMFRFRVSKHSFKWALLGRGGGAAQVSQHQGGGERVRKGREGPRRAWGDQGWDQSHTRTHTHLFFSNLLWTSLVPIL